MTEKNSSHRVLIVGGGIAGMATAIALAERGDSVEVVELNTDWVVSGWGLSLTGPCLRALKALGVAETCLEHGFGFAQITNCGPDGEARHVVDLPRLLGPDLPAQAGLSRAVLHRILREEAGARGAVLRTGLTAAGFEQSGDGVEVSMSDGSRRSVDLVVGADGIRSATRGMLGIPAKPEYTGQMVWRAIIPRPAWVTTLHTFPGPVHNAGVIPISQTHAYAFFTQNGAEPQILPQEELADRMVALMEGFCPKVDEVRATITDPQDVVHRRAQICFVDGPWHRGRIVLIGDAAHAPSPQLVSGAALAIEDGIVLAEELDRSADVETALETFGARRLERCRLVVDTSMEIVALERAGRHDQIPVVQNACHQTLALPA